MNIAAYCRVSTDKADQLNSLEAQKEFFSEYIKQQVNPKIFRVILPTLCYTQTQDIRSDCKGILLSKKAHIWNIRGTLPLSLYIRAPFQARFLQCLQTKVRTCLKPCQLLTLYEL